MDWLDTGNLMQMKDPLLLIIRATRIMDISSVLHGAMMCPFLAAPIPLPPTTTRKPTGMMAVVNILVITPSALMGSLIMSRWGEPM